MRPARRAKIELEDTERLGLVMRFARAGDPIDDRSGRAVARRQMPAWKTTKSAARKAKPATSRSETATPGRCRRRVGAGGDAAWRWRRRRAAGITLRDVHAFAGGVHRGRGEGQPDPGLRRAARRR